MVFLNGFDGFLAVLVFFLNGFDGFDGFLAVLVVFLNGFDGFLAGLMFF